MFELSQLRCFVAVAEERHFGRAALRLNMTQPPLSRQIRLLEHQVGTELLHRTSRSVSLTAAGRSFLPDAARLLRLAEEASASARRVAGGMAGTLGVGYTATVGYGLLPSLVRAIRARVPGVSLTLKGVLEAGFLCTDDSCNNSTISQNADGSFNVIAYPVDENGSAVTSSTYSNGYWDIEELDNQGIVTIKTENPGPFNAPNLDASGWDAQPFTFTCSHTGETTIGIRLLASDPANGPVTGFNYDQTNYPRPRDVLGSVGADLFFGNTLPVHCEAFGSVVITVN